MPSRPRHAPSSVKGSPFLARVMLRKDRIQPAVHPFNIPLLQHGLDIELSTLVTLLVGENGSGKSTLLEALAWAVGFSSRQRVTDGFFLRAETFFNFATYLETVGSTFGSYGGQSLHAQSHGEAFLSLFQHRFEDGLYLLDEPEAALSPQRQLAFLGILHSLTASRIAQFIIATHSPMLLTFPGAVVLSLDGAGIRRVAFEDTEHYRITKDFLDAPERFYRHLFEKEDEMGDSAV